MFNTYWLYNNYSAKPDWASFDSILPNEFDVVIIGAGLAGLFTGLEMAKQKRSCLILDSGIAGARSSSKSPGLFFVGPTDTTTETSDFYKLLSLSIENRTLFDKLSLTFTTRNWCEFQQMGGIRIANNKEEADRLRALIDIYKRFNIYATWLSEQTFKNITGVRYGDGAMFLPNEGIFNPLSLVNSLVNLNRAVGNKVISGITFSHLENLSNGKALVVDVDGNVIQANTVILSTNAFGVHTNIEFFKKHIKPVRVQYIATKKIEKELLSSVPPYAFSLNDGAEYFRVHNDRLVFGGGNKSQSIPEREINTLADANSNEYITSLLSGRMAYHLRFIGPETIMPEFIWTRIVSHTTHDNLPVIGKLEGYNNVYLNTSYAEHGISYLLIGAKIIAEIINEGKSKVYGADLFAPSRFK